MNRCCGWLHGPTLLVLLAGVLVLTGCLGGEPVKSRIAEPPESPPTSGAPPTAGSIKGGADPAGAETDAAISALREQADSIEHALAGASPESAEALKAWQERTESMLRGLVEARQVASTSPPDQTDTDAAGEESVRTLGGLLASAVGGPPAAVAALLGWGYREFRRNQREKTLQSQMAADRVVFGKWLIAGKGVVESFQAWRRSAPAEERDAVTSAVANAQDPETVRFVEWARNRNNIAELDHLLRDVAEKAA